MIGAPLKDQAFCWEKKKLYGSRRTYINKKTNGSVVGKNKDRRQEGTDLQFRLPGRTPESIRSQLEQLGSETSYQKRSEQHLAELPSEI
jgi:hypothetical protein